MMPNKKKQVPETAEMTPHQGTTSVSAPDGQSKPAVATPTPKTEPTEEDQVKIARLYGVSDFKVASYFINQAAKLQSPWANWYAGDNRDLALTSLLEMRPRSILEAMLGVQILGVHAMAVAFLTKAATRNPKESLLCAERLMRLYLEQIKVLSKLKGEG